MWEYIGSTRSRGDVSLAPAAGLHRIINCIVLSEHFRGATVVASVAGDLSVTSRSSS